MASNKVLSCTLVSLLMCSLLACSKPSQELKSEKVPTGGHHQEKDGTHDKTIPGNKFSADWTGLGQSTQGTVTTDCDTMTIKLRVFKDKLRVDQYDFVCSTLSFTHTKTSFDIKDGQLFVNKDVYGTMTDNQILISFTNRNVLYKISMTVNDAGTRLIVTEDVGNGTTRFQGQLRHN